MNNFGIPSIFMLYIYFLTACLYTKQISYSCSFSFVLSMIPSVIIKIFDTMVLSILVWPDHLGMGP